jgi:hypothetical protein
MQTSAAGVVAVRSLRFERKMGGSVVGAFAWLARRKQRFKSGRRETSTSGVCAELSSATTAFFADYGVGTTVHGSLPRIRTLPSQLLDSISPHSCPPLRSTPHHNGPLLALTLPFPSR